MLLDGAYKNFTNKINKDIKSLELINFLPKNDLSFLSKLKELEVIKIKDSYINFENFYTNLCSLKKLKKLTYNSYCYFTKINKNSFSKKLSLPSLKKFTIEFPSIKEPNLEFSSYIGKSYKEKNNSITDVKGFEKIFNNLEEIEFLNYETYQSRILKEEETADIKKLDEEIYWNTSFKKLEKLKKLKNIKINEGTYENLLELGLDKFFDRKDEILLNGFKSFNHEHFKKIKILQFFNDREKKTHSIISNINPKILDQYKNFLKEGISLSINEYNYYKTNGFDEPFTILKNKKYEEILNNDIETIIFSADFITNNTMGYHEYLFKGIIFEKIFKGQKKLKHIILDLQMKSSYRVWTISQIYILNNFMFQFTKIFPNIRFYFFHEKANKILNNEKSEDNFHLFFLLLYNIFQNSNYKDRVSFFSADKTELEKQFNLYLDSHIDQVIIIDDIIYNNTDYFPKKFVIHPDSIDSIYEYFPGAKINNEMLTKHRNNNLGETRDIEGIIFYEILRVASFNASQRIYKYFDIDKSKLLLVISKNELKDYSNLNFKKVFYYIGSPAHHISQMMDYNQGHWNKKTIVTDLDNITPDKIKKANPNILEAAENAASSITNSKYFNSKNLSAEALLKNVEEYELISDLGLNLDQFKNLELFWLEGVRPWQQRYIKLNDINKIIPSQNLKILRLSDCIYFENTKIPELPNLETLSIAPHQNHHNKKESNLTISGFENCKNLKILDINILRNYYNKKLFHKTLSNSVFDYIDSYSYINLDLANLHELKKLKKIYIGEVTSKNISKLQTLPSLEELFMNVFHHTPKEKFNINMSEPEISDKDLLFLKNSKNLKDLELSLGSIAMKEDIHHGSTFEDIDSSYSGNGEFIDFIDYKIKRINLKINFKKKNLLKIKDIINRISNRFSSLEDLSLSFGIAKDYKISETEYENICAEIEPITIDFSKFSNLKSLKKLEFQHYGLDNFVPFKTLNLKSIINFNEIKTLAYNWDSVDFKELRAARTALKNEKFSNPNLYDDEYDDGDKNWNRAEFIDTDSVDWISFETRYINLEKEENKKKFSKPKLIIKKN